MARHAGQVSLTAFKGTYDKEKLKRQLLEYLAEHSNASEHTLARATHARADRVHACLLELRRNLEVDDYEKDGQTMWHYVVDLSKVPDRSFVDTARADHAIVKQSLKNYINHKNNKKRG